MTSESFLVILTDTFPADLLEGDLVKFPLGPPAALQRWALRCTRVVQVPGGMLELTLEADNPPHAKVGAVWLHSHHVLAVLSLRERSGPLGFAPGAPPSPSGS